jgi:hypothetical protein
MEFEHFLNKIALAFVLIGTSALLSCNNNPAGNPPASDTVKTNTIPAAEDPAKIPVVPADIDSEQFAIEYLTIADTGKNYYKLESEMFDLQRKYGWVIDTMDRYYNAKENKIVLSDTADDEVYRGEYFERRFLSQNMSLEYYRSYSDNSSIKNIALVCGLYETKKSADSLLTILKSNAPGAFVIKARMYMGCEH